MRPRLRTPHSSNESSFFGGASADCLAGIGREKNRLFTVLDLSALLRRGPGATRGARGAHARS